MREGKGDAHADSSEVAQHGAGRYVLELYHLRLPFTAPKLDKSQFCAGAELKAIAARRPNRLEPTGEDPMGPSRLLLTKPVIAAISGYAVAGGLELALWCDIRVMEEDAVLGVFFRRWGIPLIDDGTARARPRVRDGSASSARRRSARS